MGALMFRGPFFSLFSDVEQANGGSFNPTALLVGKPHFCKLEEVFRLDIDVGSHIDDGPTREVAHAPSAAFDAKL